MIVILQRTWRVGPKPYHCRLIKDSIVSPLPPPPLLRSHSTVQRKLSESNVDINEPEIIRNRARASIKDETGYILHNTVLLLRLHPSRCRVLNPALNFPPIFRRKKRLI
jgi:hypothetical protein